VVGDTQYGAPARLVLAPSRQSVKQTGDSEAESLAMKRNFLHAAELEFAHPRTGETIRVKSELPGELESLLRAIE
jgi:23S rRNA pseudouridine1911/1915/1917 synthase